MLSTFYAQGTAYIFICPSFFLLTPKPTTRLCPKVTANRFEGSQGDLHQKYQTYSLVYDLIRFYLGKNALDARSTPPEEFDWNRCVFNLDEIESVLNPTNLELFIARELTRKTIQDHDCDF